VGAVSNFGYGPNAGPGLTNQEIVCTREAALPDEVAPRKASVQPKPIRRMAPGFRRRARFPPARRGSTSAFRAKQRKRLAPTRAIHSAKEPMTTPEPATSPRSRSASTLRFELAFCGDALCRVDILTHAGADGGWTQRFLELRAALEERYGRPTTTRSVLPQECVTTLSACLAAGTVGFWVSWKWSAGEMITLAMGKREGKPLIRVAYDRPSALAAPRPLTGSSSSPAAKKISNQRREGDEPEPEADRRRARENRRADRRRLGPLTASTAFGRRWWQIR